MADGKISLPGMGGLMRYDEEYDSRFMISPAAVIGFCIGLVVLVIALKVIWPVG